MADLRSRRLGFDLWKSCVQISGRRYKPHVLFTVEVRMTLYQGFIQLGAGLSVGLSGLAAGFAIGIVGDAGVRGTAQQPSLFVVMVRISCVLSDCQFTFVL
jgi:F0F1-type ATP synthase membrane subunit c/vacuolar-type H+-ATPase subunit K